MGYINATTYPSFGRSLRLYYEERNVNTEANTSDIYWELQGYNRQPDATGYYYAGPFNVTINGVKVANNIYPGGSRIQLRDGTVVASGTLANIAHDADGSKSVTASFDCDFIYDSTNKAAGSGSIPLSTIPRASTVAISDGLFGSAWQYTVTAYSTAFTHDITVTIGSHTITRSDRPAGGEVFAAATTRGWADAAPTTDSATITVTVVTKSNGTPIGTVTETATMRVPDSWKPSTPVPASAAPVNDFAGDALQYVSKADVSFTFQASPGTELASGKIWGPGINLSFAAMGGQTIINRTLQTATLTQSGALTWNIQLTDKRGRTTTTQATMTVKPYRMPSATLTVHRCNSDGTLNDLGAYMKATAVCTFDTSIANNASGVYLTIYSGGVPSVLGSLVNQTTSPYTYTTPVHAVSTTDTYLVEAFVQDEVLLGLGADQGVTITTRLSTAEVLMDFKAGGDGVAFGGSATESQVVAVKNWDLHLDNPLGLAYGGTGVTGVTQSTWSTAMTVAYSDGTSLTVTNKTAKMDRFGPIVHLYGYFRITDLGTTGSKNLRIGGLPVTITVPLSGTGTPFFMSAAPSDGIPMICQVVSGGQSIDVIRGPQAANSRAQLVAGWCSFDLWAFVA